jgi:hypothetical protein
VSKPKAATYHCGVGVNAGGALIGWVFRSGTANVSRARGSAVRVLEEQVHRTTPDRANGIRNMLKRKHRAAIEAEAKRAAEVGRVAVHCDRQGHHPAVILDPTPECFALIITSRTGWAKRARPLTPEEAAICKVKHGPSHFAPVVRPREQFSIRGPQLPAWRIGELLAEFRREDAA